MNFNSYREIWYDLMLFPWLVHVPAYWKEIYTFFKIEPNPCIVLIEQYDHFKPFSVMTDIFRLL